MTDRYHEQLDLVERTHWWFRALRALVLDTVVGLLPPGSRVLDVGCSTGHLLAALPPAYERTGVDVSAPAIELARARHPGIRFQLASVEALPFEPASFDAVLATDVVSAVGVEDDLGALREMRRVLRPDGVLILQVAAYEWLRSGHDAASGTARRYRLPALRRLLRAAGFAPAHLTYRVTLPFPAAALRRLRRRHRAETDVAPVHPALNGALATLMAVERPLARRLRLPFGLSIFAVATAAPSSH